MLRSIGAVLGGFVAVVILSTVTDEVLHLLQVYPPWTEPMWDPKLNALALAYRILFTIIGGYLTARLAPRNPMKHVFVLGVIGTIAGIAGAITAMSLADLGPKWYPIAVAATGFPSVWIGGLLHQRRRVQLTEQRL
jgi:hypothetical protein